MVGRVLMFHITDASRFPFDALQSAAKLCFFGLNLGLFAIELLIFQIPLALRLGIFMLTLLVNSTASCKVSIADLVKFGQT